MKTKRRIIAAFFAFILTLPLLVSCALDPIEASEEELAVNPRSRSAKLRVVRKLRDADEMRLLGVEAM